MLETELVHVTDARHVRDHVLWLRFSDGLSGEVDLADEIRGELLAPLRDAKVFAQLGLECGTVVWPNGLDWSSESLYDRLRAAKGLPAHSVDDRRRRQLEHAARMPEISRFFGIIIRMLANEHQPPHFHAVHGEYEISVTVRDRIVTGRFPPTALRLVLEWAELHQHELLANWDTMRRGEAPQPVAPLE